MLTVIDGLGRAGVKRVEINLLDPTAVPGVPSPFITRVLPSPLSSTTLSGLLGTIIDYLLLLSTSLLVLLIVFSGFTYMFGGPRPALKVLSIKTLNYALLGYIIILLAKVALAVVVGVLLQ